MHPLLALIVALCGAVLVVVTPMMLAAYRKFRGARLVTCPETHQPAAVTVDAGHAALTAALDGVELRLSGCSRWPERRECGQACLQEIEAAPAACLVRTIVAEWYAGRRCALCGKALAATDVWPNAPALMGPDGRTVMWCDVQVASLPETFRTHRPICWNCHIAETLRREHPELVIEARRETSPPSHA
jgi:hypothetical protein